MGCLSLRVEGKVPNDLTLWTDDAVYIDFIDIPGNNYKIQILRLVSHLSRHSLFYIHTCNFPSL